MNIFNIIKKAYKRIISNDISPLVLKEAKNLNKFASKEELNKLQLTTLDPDHISKCIYGQITGSCFSARAQDLIELCCEKIYDIITYNKSLQTAILNGSPKGRARRSYWSPIEVFIYKNRENKRILAKLVKIIKGK